MTTLKNISSGVIALPACLAATPTKLSAGDSATTALSIGEVLTLVGSDPSIEVVGAAGGPVVGTSGAGSAHTHTANLSFGGSVQMIAQESVLIRPDGAGTEYVSNTASGDAQPKAATGQPDYPRAVALLLDGAWNNGFGAMGSPVTVSIVGQIRGVGALSDTIVIPGGSLPGDVIEGVAPFDHITQITWDTPAGWIAGGFAVQSIAGKFGLPLPLTLPATIGLDGCTVWDETALPPNPTAETPTGDAPNGTWTPATPPDAVHSYRLVYRLVYRWGYTPSGSAYGTTDAESAHTHGAGSYSV